MKQLYIRDIRLRELRYGVWYRVEFDVCVAWSRKSRDSYTLYKIHFLPWQQTTTCTCVGWFIVIFVFQRNHSDRFNTLFQSSNFVGFFVIKEKKQKNEDFDSCLQPSKVMVLIIITTITIKMRTGIRMTECDNSRTYILEVRQYYGLVLLCFQPCKYHV
jgi:hypothetical protein